MDYHFVTFFFFVITDPTQAAYATGPQMLDVTND